MALTRLKAILPSKSVTPAVYTKHMKEAATRTGTIVKAQYSRTVRTWRNKPTFTTTTSITNGRISTNTGTDNEIYGYINNGTSVRYAVMTPDFVSKTEPRIVNSRAGAGGFSHFSFQNPRPGIQARQYDVTIAKEQAKNIAKILQEEIDRAVVESGQAL